MDDRTNSRSGAAGDSEPTASQEALRGTDVDAFMPDETRAAPVGPTEDADIRDLRGTPNEKITDCIETDARDAA